jgi:hypothetical protein
MKLHSLPVLTLLAAVSLAGCKTKQPEASTPSGASTQANNADPLKDRVLPEDPDEVNRVPGLTEQQRHYVISTRLFGGGPECSGEGLRSAPDPDLAYAQCFYYERKDYHIKAYRERFAATPDARINSCFEHKWIGEALAKPPTDGDYALAIKQICVLGFADSDKVDKLRKTVRH